MPLTVGDRLGPYEILASIGAGSMGEVYRARDTKLKRDVALKVLPEAFARDPERMARFQREAEVLASLNHPNIAHIYGVEERALIMELVEGESPKGPLAFDEAWRICAQIADALEYAHEKGVIHRDLKPANVKVTPEGVVKLLDFGLAKAFTGQRDASPSAGPENSPTLTMGATEVGVILGTASYMSPEQAKGKQVDKRADIWAFGVMLYELLAGRRPFEGEEVGDVLASVIKEEPTFRSIPVQANRLLRRCLEKDPKRRLRDIGEARFLLEEPPASAIVPPQRPFGQFSWGITAVAAVIAAALAFVLLRETPPGLQTARFEIAPPQKTAIETFELSPDGRYLAMAAGESGKVQIWVRPIDSLEARALPGTADAELPFWSPDSTYIGFSADGKLKKVAVTGGPAETLCGAFTFRGGTWNQDGVIVFSSDFKLYRVTAAGGIRIPVMMSPNTEQARFPAFLPGGRRFLYTVSGGKPETSGVYVGSLDGGAPVRILADQSRALYAPTDDQSQRGHILFRRESTLMAQPFNAAGLRLGGEAFPVAERVRDAGNVNRAAFSVSAAGTLAYAQGSAGVGRQLVWVDRKGKRLGVIEKPGSISFELLSPDEKRVAFSRDDGSGNSDIWLYEFARGIATRFTFGPGLDGEAVWSPDGSRIVYASGPQVVGPADIYQKPVNGPGKEELVLRVGRNLRIQDWSGDGKVLVYVPDVGDPKTKSDLWLLPLTGERKPVPYLATQFNETNGQLSPDGKWMAYRSDESGQDQVYVQPVPATGTKFQISAAGGGRPRWRRDGKELFYTSADGKLMAVPIKLGASIETGAAQPLFDFPTSLPLAPHQFLYQPTADGQRFLMNVPSGEEESSAPITVVMNWRAGLKK